MFICKTLLYFPLLFSLITLYSVFFRVPFQDDTFLVESLKYVQEYPFPKGLTTLSDHKYGFKLLRVLDYDVMTPKYYLNRKYQKPIIIIMTQGSHGRYLQIPATFNTIYNHTMYLNNIQNDTFYRLHAFTFNFQEMPSAFSKSILEQQATYVKDAVQYIMKQEFQKEGFHLLGHSMGGVVNFLASVLEGFPIKQFKTQIVVNSPLSASPMYLNSEVLEIQARIVQEPQFKIIKENVLHINIHGGTRDHLVKSEIGIYNHKFDMKYKVHLFTEEMKNLYQSIDHNASYYYKYFFDAIIPAILKVLLDENGLENQVQLAQKLFYFNEKISNYSDFHMLESQITKQYPTQVFKGKQIVLSDELAHNLILVSKEANQQEIIIYGNLERFYDIKLLIIEKIGDYQMILSNHIKNERNFYPANFFEIRIKDLTPYEEIFLEIDRKDSEILYIDDIQHYSPSFDKRTPTIIPHIKEPFSYISIKKDDVKLKLFEIDIVTSIFGVEFNTDLVDIIEIQQDFKSTTLFATMFPLQICMVSQYSLPIVLKYQEEFQNQQLFQLNEKKPCAFIHPRRTENKDHSSTIKIYKYDLDEPVILLIKPNYFQMLRESLLNNQWVINYLSTLIILIKPFYSSFLITQILPIIALIRHIDTFEQTYFQELLFRRYTLHLSILDVLVIFFMSELIKSLSHIIYSFIRFIGKMTGAFICLKIFKKALKWTLIVIIIFAFVTRSFIFLIFPLVFQFSLVEVKKNIFFLELILFILRSDKLVIDFWRYFQHWKLSNLWTNDFQSDDRFEIFKLSILLWISINNIKINVSKSTQKFLRLSALLFYILKLINVSDHFYMLIQLKGSLI